MTFVRRLPDYVINGIAVTLGVGCIQHLTSVLVGP